MDANVQLPHSNSPIQNSEDCAFKLMAEMQKAAIRFKQYEHKNIPLDGEFMGLEIIVNFKEKKKAEIDGAKLEHALAYALGQTVKINAEQFGGALKILKRELGL